MEARTVGQNLTLYADIDDAPFIVALCSRGLGLV